MVAQEVKSTTGRQSKRLFIDRRTTVELKKYAATSAVFIPRITGADARVLGLRSLARQIFSTPFFGCCPKIECIENKFTRALDEIHYPCGPAENRFLIN
jgi:hypothetical protein